MIRPDLEMLKIAMGRELEEEIKKRGKRGEGRIKWCVPSSIPATMLAKLSSNTVQTKEEI